ncbi:hypothetical protein Vi05172_g9565 [Venturia inaequalis]|nr:hypothetical protein Vi05172_g9565 [Venturia inaequalis]
MPPNASNASNASNAASRDGAQLQDSQMKKLRSQFTRTRIECRPASSFVPVSQFPRCQRHSVTPTMPSNSFKCRLKGWNTASRWPDEEPQITVHANTMECRLF